jgi:hypothetical protein
MRQSPISPRRSYSIGISEKPTSSEFGAYSRIHAIRQATRRADCDMIAACPPKRVPRRGALFEIVNAAGCRVTLTLGLSTPGSSCQGLALASTSLFLRDWCCRSKLVDPKAKPWDDGGVCGMRTICCSATQTRRRQNRATQTGHRQDRATQTGRRQNRATQTGHRQNRATQTGRRQNRATQTGPLQNGATLTQPLRNEGLP